MSDVHVRVCACVRVCVSYRGGESLFPHVFLYEGDTDSHSRQSNHL